MECHSLKKSTNKHSNVYVNIHITLECLVWFMHPHNSITFLNSHVDHVSAPCSLRILILSTVCNDSLGIEDRRIPDSSFFASSEASSYYAATNARLNRPADYDDNGRPTSSGAWSPATQDANQSIGVNLGGVKIVSGIVLQGRDDDQDEWVTMFKVEYMDDADAEHAALMVVKDANQEEEMVRLFLLYFHLLVDWYQYLYMYLGASHIILLIAIT